LAQLGVGLTEFINEDQRFFYTNIACRFLEGVGDAWIQTAGYSLIALKFPENREKFIAWGEIASGIGLMAGPGIAGFLYTFLGYFKAFFIFVVFIGISGILSLIFIP
jgi:MFS family permease